MLIAGFALLLMLVSATPSARATPPAANVTALPPVVWELLEISGSTANPVHVAQPERYSVQFRPDGTLAVTTDCNQATGVYTGDRRTLDVTLAVSTLAVCPQLSQGEQFLAGLDSATAYAFDTEGFLVLTGEDGRLRLRAALSGVRWEWQSFRGGDDSFVAPSQPENYSLTFLPNGKLAIQADCNRVMGTFAAEGPALEISADIDTRATCSPGSLSDQFLRDLDDVSSHVFRDGNLYLSLWADAGILELAARYDEPPVATPQAG